MEEPAFIICRECTVILKKEDVSRCPNCGSPRLLSHPELQRLTIAHVDCDAFYATVEKRDNPSLISKPVIVGGNSPRGVVSTACYIARSFGVHSTMPMYKAKQLCPQGVFLHPNFKKYKEVSRALHQLMQKLTPLIEPLSLDEAFLDFAGTEKLHKKCAAELLTILSSQVEKDLGITLSVGLSYNKYLAKIASDFEKPKGFSVIGRKEAPDFLKDKSISIIPGIGRVTISKLEKHGILTINDVRHCNERILLQIFGNDSNRIKNMIWGLDTREISPNRETKSISSETTLEKDLASFEDLEPILWNLCEKTCDRIKKTHLAYSNVTLKLKDNNFRLRTRSQSFSGATQLVSRLFSVSRQLLKAECDGTSYRLIGVGVSDLVPESQKELQDLSDPDFSRKLKTETAIDTLRNKFGNSIIQKGITLREKKE